jgi:hypothetical protein
VVAQGKAAAADVQRVALDFLGSGDIVHWTVSAMGGH